MSEAPLQGVLYGHGHMGRFHAAKLAERTDVELLIVDPEQGLDPNGSIQPDFAIVATPTNTHAQIAQPLLLNGIPCLVEKPLANEIDEAKQLAQYAHLSVGHIERFNPVFSVLENALPEFIEIERLAPFQPRSTDVDVIADLMIHDLDLLPRFMPGRLMDVRAKGVGVMGEQPDIVNARLEYALPSGRIGVVNLTASRVSAKSIRTWRVIDSDRYWSLDLRNHQAKVVEWSHKTMHEETLSVPQQDALQAEHNAFLGAVRQQRPFPCPGVEALHALQLAQRIRECLH